MGLKVEGGFIFFTSPHPNPLPIGENRFNNEASRELKTLGKLSHHIFRFEKLNHDIHQPTRDNDHLTWLLATHVALHSLTC